MRESRSYGSVRGARSNARPYRDQSPPRSPETRTTAATSNNTYSAALVRLRSRSRARSSRSRTPASAA